MLSSPETEILSPWCPAGLGAPRTAAARAVLTGVAGNPDSGSQRARYRKTQFISTRLLQIKPKRCSHEAYTDKKKGISLTLLAKNFSGPPCRECTEGQQKLLLHAAGRAWAADHSAQWMPVSLPSHSLTGIKSLANKKTQLFSFFAPH